MFGRLNSFLFYLYFYIFVLVIIQYYVSSKKGQFSQGFILIIVIVKLFPPANWLVIRNRWLKWDIFKSQVEYLLRFCYFQVDCFFGKKGRKCNNRSIFFKMFVKRMLTSFCTSRLLETVMVFFKNLNCTFVFSKDTRGIIPSAFIVNVILWSVCVFYCICHLFEQFLFYFLFLCLVRWL